MQISHIALCGVLTIQLIDSVSAGQLAGAGYHNVEGQHGSEGYEQGHGLDHHSGGHSQQYHSNHGNFEYEIDVKHPQLISSHGDHKHHHALVEDRGIQVQKFHHHHHHHLQQHHEGLGHYGHSTEGLADLHHGHQQHY